jgi:hypothetical protein
MRSVLTNLWIEGEVLILEGDVMKTRNTLTKLIAITLTGAALLAAALFGGDGMLQPVAAQIGDGSVKYVRYTSLGIVPGEKVRLSVANDETSAGTLTYRFSYYLAHGTNASTGVPLYESGLMQVPSGEFRFADVSRKDLRTEGEPLTGRAQLLVGVTMFVPAGSNPEDFPVSLEVFKDEDGDGNAVQVDSKYRLIILAAKRSKQLIRMSFSHGQSLRYTFFNPTEESVRVSAYGYDATGRLMTLTDPVELRPGDSYTAIINRDDLLEEGEKGTGRVHMGTGIQAVLMDGSVRHFDLPVWVELVNNRTGQTQGGDYYTGTVSVSGDGE